MRSIKRAQAHGVENLAKFAQKKGLVFETEAFCCCRRHCPISSVFREESNFQKYLGVYNVFEGCSVKGKAARETIPRNNRMENQTCKRLKICIPRESLAHAQTLFSFVRNTWNITEIDRQIRWSAAPFSYASRV